MLYNAIAEKFIAKLTAYTKYNINIMDEKGIIIASRNPERVGTFHEAAFDIITHNREIAYISQDDRMLGTRPGVNLPLYHQGKVIGVIGVTGDPDEVQPIAHIVKMAMETMLDYEYQREELTKRRSRKKHFVYQLISGSVTDTSELVTEAASLGYKEDLMRVPILIHFEDQVDPQRLLDQIKLEKHHTLQDISLVTREGEILIYKCLPEQADIISNYKFLIAEYMHPFLMQALEKELRYQFFVGSIQDRFNYYSCSYEHCQWLKQARPGTSRGLFFYDYVDDYMKSRIAEVEYHRLFNCLKKRMTEKYQDLYRETIGCLKKNNYNMVMASKDIYVHKNTFAFRLDKIRESLNMNPVRNNRDREFMEYLLYYLEK